MRSSPSRSALFTLCACLTALWAAPGHAVTPTTLAIDGAVTSVSGGPAADGVYPVTFSLFKAEAGGQAIWTEPVAAITVKAGGFHGVLGVQVPVKPEILVDGAWLEVKIEPDPALPRVALRSVAYALRASRADALDCSGCIGAAQLDAAVLQPFAKSASLAKVSSSGNYADLLGTPKLADVATTGSYGDLNGTPKFAAVAASGAYADLTGAPTLAKLGTSCGSGLVIKGLKVDGSYECVVAMDPSALPPDGLDEISNKLLTNQFVEVAASSGPVDLLDNVPGGTTATIDVPDLGLAQKLTVTVDLVNSDLSTLKVTLLDPAGAAYVLWDKTAPGTELKKTFADPDKLVSGDLALWNGKNPKGKWKLVVVDSAFLNNTVDGKLNSWSVNVATLSSKKVAANGTLLTNAGLKLMLADSAPVVCDASQLGFLYLDTKEKALEVCNGQSWYPIAITAWGTQANPALHCKDLLAKQPSAKDGLYWIDPNGGAAADAFQAYCDMADGGGGWTLVARMTNGCMTDGAGAVATLTGPGQASCGKFSDTVINQIRTASGSDGVFWGWHDGSAYAMPKTGRYLKIVNGTFDAGNTQGGLQQQCSCAPTGPWSASYDAHSGMSGVYNHSSGGWQCVTVGQAGCTDQSVFPQSLFLYQHALHQAGTFPSNSHGVPGGAAGWLYLR